MPIFQLPPPTFIGGAQPHAPKELPPQITAVPEDNPPFTNRGRVAVLATIVALCQPPDPSPHIGGRQPLEPPKLNPQITAVQVDDPPFTHRERTPQHVAIVGQSQPPAWTYTFFGGFAPYVPEYCAAFSVERVDNPPFENRGRAAALNSILAAHQPDPWRYNALGPAGGLQPYAPRQLAPQITAVQVDDPPFTARERTAQHAAIVGQVQPNPWTYHALGPATGLQPYAPKLLNPSITAVAVDNPPFSHRERSAQHQAIVGQVQPDPWTYRFAGRAPYLPKQLAPGIPGQSTDPPPTTLPEDLVVTAAIKAMWQPEVWTYNFAGGLQPYTPRKLSPGVPGQSVNNPPFTLGGPIALPAEIVSLAQPASWPYSFFGGRQPYAPRTLAPGIPGQSVDAPPVVHPERDAVTIAGKGAWQPDPWVYDYLGPAAGTQPYAPRLLNPSTAAVRVDDPPFTYGGPIAVPASVIAGNQPAAWPYTFVGGAQPYAPSRLSAAILGVANDNPPFQEGGPVAIEAAIVGASQPDPWSYRYLGPAGGLQPYGPRLLNPALLAVQVDDPPFTRRRALDPASWWLPDPPLPQQSPKLVQPFTADTVPSSRPWLSAVLAAWADPAPLPQQRGALSPGIPGQSVDSPPPRQTRPITWPAVDPLPQLAGKLSPGIPGQSVDQPPVRQVKPVTWPAPDPQPQSAGKLSPGIPGQSVDNPPFVHRERTLQHASVVAACQPNPWTYSFQGGLQPYDYRKLPQGQAVFDPPFTYGGPYALPAELVAAAQPSAWTYTFAGGLQPFAPRRLTPSVIAVAVDNPPFDSRALSLRAELVALWQPVELAPTLPRPGVVPEPPPEPVAVAPPPGGGDYPRHLKKPLRPIWDRAPEPAPTVDVRHVPDTPAPEPKAERKPVKPAPLRSFDGLAQALTPPQAAPAPQAEAPELERRRVARLEIVEASDHTAVVEQDDQVTAQVAVATSAELHHTEPDDQLSAVGFVAIAASLRHHDANDKLVALVVHETVDQENDDEEVIALLMQQL